MRLTADFADKVTFAWVANEQNKTADKLATDQTRNQNARFARREMCFTET